MPDDEYSPSFSPYSAETTPDSHKRQCLLTTPVSGGSVVSRCINTQLHSHIIITGAESNVHDRGIVSKERAIDFFPWDSPWKYQSEEQTQMIRNLMLSYIRSFVTNVPQEEQKLQTSRHESLETHSLHNIKRGPKRPIIYINIAPMDNFSMLVDAFSKGEYNKVNLVPPSDWNADWVLLPFTPSIIFL